MSARAFIVADDLTGAADCGALCAARGLDTLVTLGRGGEAEALAIDADTRAMPAGDAARATAHAVSAYARGDEGFLFKKLDSTLRGHVGAELAAFLAACRVLRPSAVAVLAPAYPALRRTTVEGRQRLDGRPLEESEVRPHESADLVALVAAHGLSAGLVPLATVRAQGDALAAAMDDSARRVDVVVCDAETDEDLARVARAAMGLGGRAVFAGAAGLAGHLVEAAGFARKRRASPSLSAQGSALFVIGSRSKVSARQAAALAACEGMVSVVVDPTATAAALAASGAAARLAAALREGKDALVWSGAEAADDGRPERPCDGLAEVVGAEGARIGALFATGGDTARRLLTALGVESLSIMREVEPGVPLSLARGQRPLPVITKAGAFGDDDTLIRCRRAFHGGVETCGRVP